MSKKILVQFNPKRTCNASGNADQEVYRRDGCQFEKQLDGIDKID